ncbi:MAG: PqqD family peptide modification chaperone [Syntrophorhabdales bacterium]
MVNAFVILREEFDDWAVLFNPDTGHGFGLNPTGVYVWKLLDGERSIDDLLKEIRSCADAVPEEALEQVGVFIGELAAEHLVEFNSTGSGLPASVKRTESFPSPPSGHGCELERFKYEPPHGHVWRGMQPSGGLGPLLNRDLPKLVLHRKYSVLPISDRLLFRNVR